MRLYALLFVALFVSLPADAEAQTVAVGDRVLVTGQFHRKCSARVEALPNPGFAQIAFDHAGCGDASQPYAFAKLQRLSFTAGAAGFKADDVVVLDGFLGGKCVAHVKEVSRSGYVSLTLDAPLCADSEGLYKTSQLTHVKFVPEADEFTVGQKVSAPGIGEEACVGRVEKLTNNGLAVLSFEQLTCAYGGKLYSLEELQPVKEAKPQRHATGEAIFQQVMREIASARKVKKQARN